MLNATHSKWLPASKTYQTANQGQNPQTTTTRSQIKVLPTSTQPIREQFQENSNNRYHQTTTKQFIQPKAPNLTRSGRPILVRRQRPREQQQQRPFLLKNYEILSQESLTQLLNQNQLLTQAHQLDLNQLLNQRLTNRVQTIPTEEELIHPLLSEEDLETTTPIYTIISVPFLARSYLPTSSVKQRKSKTNGLIETKPILVTANGKDGQTITLCPDQKNTLAHLNLLNQQKKQHSNKSNNSQLNTIAAQNIHEKSESTLNTTVCNNIDQINTTTKSSNTTPTSLNTTRTPLTRTSAEMMGIPGHEFQDMNLALQIAAVEELMAPVCLDDYIIETNNNSDFDANNGTLKLQGLNEMTINQTNEHFADQLQSYETHEAQFMNEVPGEEKYFNITRQPHSEELISLTQSSLGQDISDYQQQFQHIDWFENSDDSLENSSAMPPGSPVPTENDCIATSKLHINKSETSLNNIMQDDEKTCRIEFSPNQSDEQHNTEEELINNIYAMLGTPPVEQNLKRNSDHFEDMKYVGAKKSRLYIPQEVVIGDTATLNTPDIYKIVLSLDEEPYLLDSSLENSHVSLNSILDIQTERTFESPASVESSFICEEPSYATPSPSNSSSCTLYSTNPNSPAVSPYNTSAKKKSRGRPPKEHSDLPDPEHLKLLSEIDRKRYTDRCKNNEASRQSRQKNKQRLQQLEAEEEEELNKNIKLKRILDKRINTHENLKKLLCQIVVEAQQ